MQLAEGACLTGRVNGERKKTIGRNFLRERPVGKVRPPATVQ